MKLQIRFLLLLCLVFLIGAGALATQYSLEKNRLVRLQQGELTHESKDFKTIVDLEGQPMQSLQKDYSFWDDMVAYVKSGNANFAKQNIDSSLDTFTVDAAWVYRTNLSLVHHAGNDKPLPVDLNLQPDFFAALQQAKFVHYYLRNGQQLIEVRAATIVPSGDPDHATAAQGYWVIARLLDVNYIQRLSDLTHGNVQMATATSPATGAVSNNSIVVAQALNDWRGQPVAVLKNTTADPASGELSRLYTNEIIVFAAFALVLIGLVSAVVWLQVLRPIRLITGAIKRQRPDDLQRLSQKQNEFGHLAATTQQFFNQKLEIEKAEFERAQLEKLNEERNAFLAAAAHELNSPVTTVKIIAENLTSSPSMSPAEVKENLDMIEHQTRKINLMISDLRSQSLGQKSDLSFREFAVDEFLKQEVIEAGFTIRQKIVLEAQADLTVVSDPDRLAQVLSNLIRNASKYSPDAAEIMVRSRVQDGNVIIEVQDFGIGISDADQAQIFKPFFRSEAVRGSYPGMGLGLSISFNIVAQLGGKLWAESKLGEGSHFYISLPINLPLG